MTAQCFLIVLQISVIACGVVAGVFLTFSDFVMRSLKLSNTAAGIEAMQMVNREVFRTIFMVLLLGMSALAPVLAGYAYFNITGPASALIMAGGTLYVTGVFGVSLVFNVPMNNRLEAMDYASAAAATYWRETYLPRWSLWNAVRAASSGAAAVCFLIAGVWLA